MEDRRVDSRTNCRGDDQKNDRKDGGQECKADVLNEELHVHMEKGELEGEE